MAAFNDEKPRSSQIILEQEVKLCAGKQAANILIRQYAETLVTYRFPHTGKEKPGKNSMQAVSTRKKQR